MTTFSRTSCWAAAGWASAAGAPARPCARASPQTAANDAAVTSRRCLDRLSMAPPFGFGVGCKGQVETRVQAPSERAARLDLHRIDRRRELRILAGGVEISCGFFAAAVHERRQRLTPVNVALDQRRHPR